MAKTRKRAERRRREQRLAHQQRTDDGLRSYSTHRDEIPVVTRFPSGEVDVVGKVTQITSDDVGLHFAAKLGSSSVPPQRNAGQPRNKKKWLRRWGRKVPQS